MGKDEIIREFEKSYLKSVPGFAVGDSVDVHVKIVEEGRKRVQVFSGVVIGRKGGGIKETFTVRKVSFGEGVERTFPVHSPNLEKIIVVKKGGVKRAKLYYLRTKIGKKAKIEGEEKFGKDETPSDAPVREEGPKEGV